MSNNLSDFTNNTINIDSINNNSTVEFKNINSTGNCILELKGSGNNKPDLKLHFGNNAHFSKVIGKNFDLFSINNNDNTSYCEFKNTLTQNGIAFCNKPIQVHGTLVFNGKCHF